MIPHMGVEEDTSHNAPEADGLQDHQDHHQPVHIIPLAKELEIDLEVDCDTG